MSVFSLSGVVLILLLATSNTGLTAITKTSQGELRLLHPRIASMDDSQSDVTRRSGTFNILALRVEFKPDTLSTTTGDGSFDYTAKDSVYYDPPPHDADYFSDMLEFNRFYWQEMSNGAIDFTWDIYPTGNEKAYLLPKEMWQYNYNYPVERDPTHLDSTLSILFRDAVAAADSDAAIVWADYDLIVVFHAGSGAEFDLGFTATPHDIPSAWMVRKDFELIGLNEGIPVSDNGVDSLITEGLILPETESHDDVQISMAGVVVFLFGHWLGLPALYDRDSGDAVVGKWSLLDRGFGNFYGVLPGPVDAWSRHYMGWLDPVELLPGDYSISARGFELPGLSDTIQTAKVYITQDEYFLIEARYRSAVGEFKDDSVAVLYDNYGNRMFLKEDYSVDIVRTDPDFRVPVRTDNLDFDSPGSGILIWHVDEKLLPLIPDGRFNSVEGHRGLDLEEADGAQDIGRDYPFLTAGYGTDYGIFEDAWYKNNEAHQNANKRDAVTFGAGTFPNSRANSGAFTGITIGNFSIADTVMNFSFTRTGNYFANPIEHNLGRVKLAVGNFDGNLDDQEFVLFALNDTIEFYDGNGVLLDRIIESGTGIHGYPTIRDINGDHVDDIIWLGISSGRINFNALTSLLGEYIFSTFDSLTGFVPNDGVKFAFGGEGDVGTVLLAIIPGMYTSEIRSYNNDLTRISSLSVDTKLGSIHRYGTAISDSFLIGAVDNLYLWQNMELSNIGTLEFDENNLLTYPFMNNRLVDIDESGHQDFIYKSTFIGPPNFVVVHDPLLNGTLSIEEIKIDPVGQFDIISPTPLDIDNNGSFELFSADGDMITVFESNGVIADGFPFNLSGNEYSNFNDINILGDILICDFNGDQKLEFICRTTSGSDYEQIEWIDGYTMDGQRLNGFPMVAPIGRYDFNMQLCQLDDEPGLELLVVTDKTFEGYDFDYSNADASVWWGQPYRDNDHSNAVWEPATPFTPASAVVLMPEDLCYNWPNPATEETRIRYFLNFDADVNVNIFDIMGEKVKSFNRSQQAAGLNHEIVWQLDDIARGIYVAVVKADGSGKTDTKVVKIAVVK
ncbi:T9SS type A sorting domain-containing protein [bacterium]|nr:T9SS type A sorting domain-containing protein [bacterium]